MSPDGSCTVRGIALGRAQLAAFRSGSEETRTEGKDDDTYAARELCASVGGGSGSAGFWGAWGAVVGALAGMAL
jgi:hypothetical protein